MVVLEKENHKSETIQHYYGAYDFFFSMLSHEISNCSSKFEFLIFGESIYDVL